MQPKRGTSPSLTFNFDIYGQQFFFKKLLQPDHLCEAHKINKGTAKNTVSHNFFKQMIFTQLLLTIRTNLPKKY